MLAIPSMISIRSKVDQNYHIELLTLSLASLDFHPTAQSAFLGVGLIVMSIFLKLWLFSYPKRKNKNFEIYGPYRFLRFPHYLSTLVLGVGVVIAARSVVVLGIFLLLFAILFISKASYLDRLREDFVGYSYSFYKRHVSALIPGLYPYPQQSSKSPSFRNLFDTRFKPEVNVLLAAGFYVAYAVGFLKWINLRQSYWIYLVIFLSLTTYFMVSKLKLKRTDS